MRLENSFAVPASPERTWALLNDVPRVVPSMPGAELTEVVDETNWKATMHVKLGPIALQFATDVRREVSDEGALQTTLAIKARELKGRGGATATGAEDVAAGPRCPSPAASARPSTTAGPSLSRSWAARFAAN